MTKLPADGYPLMEEVLRAMTNAAPNLVQPSETVRVTCGGCDRELECTHLTWHMGTGVTCPSCGAGADLVHARRHVDCGICAA